MSQENKILNGEQWNCDNDNDLDDSYSIDSGSSVHRVGNGFSKQRAYYTSNGSSSFIRNAATGVQYPFRVGSNEARQLFKIVDTTGIYDVNGKKYMPPRYRSPKDPKPEKLQVLPNPNPNHLYYDSPEEYARHFSTKQRVNVSVNIEFAKAWQERKKSFIVSEKPTV